jgi:hypothetical protein
VSDLFASEHFSKMVIRTKIAQFESSAENSRAKTLAYEAAESYHFSSHISSPLPTSLEQT